MLLPMARTLALVILICGCSDGTLGSRRDASMIAADADAAADASGDAFVRDVGTADSRTDVGSDSGSDSGSDAAMDIDGGRGSGGVGGAYPGAQTRTASFGGSSYDYALYLPTSYDPTEPVALLSIFHGQGDTGANMRNFWRSTAESGGFAVMATSSTGASGGWTPSADVPRYDAALTDALGAYNIDEGRLYVWGFSAGAHLTHAVALMNTDTFAAYGVSAGVLAALAGPGAPSAAARRIPVDIHIGTDDPLFSEAEADRGRFVSAGWVEGDDFRYTAFPGGHTVRPDQLPTIWAFFESFSLP